LTTINYTLQSKEVIICAGFTTTNILVLKNHLSFNILLRNIVVKTSPRCQFPNILRPAEPKRVKKDSQVSVYLRFRDLCEQKLLINMLVKLTPKEVQQKVWELISPQYIFTKENKEAHCTDIFRCYYCKRHYFEVPLWHVMS